MYLWHPKFKGALSLYNSTVQPLLRKHEATIDLKVEEARAWLGDVFSANFKWCAHSLLCCSSRWDRACA